jgi:hypothetical protein
MTGAIEQLVIADRLHRFAPSCPCWSVAGIAGVVARNIVLVMAQLRSRLASARSSTAKQMAARPPNENAQVTHSRVFGTDNVPGLPRKPRLRRLRHAAHVALRELALGSGQ